MPQPYHLLSSDLHDNQLVWCNYYLRASYALIKSARVNQIALELQQHAAVAPDVTLPRRCIAAHLPSTAAMDQQVGMRGGMLCSYDKNHDRSHLRVLSVMQRLSACR